MRHILYSVIQKNRKTLKHPKYYGRIREGTKEKLVPLDTTDKKVAELWLRQVTRVRDEINDLEQAGLEVPDELAAKLVSIDTPVFAQKRASKPFSAPGGTLDAWEMDARLRGFRESTIANYQRAFRNLLANLSPEDLTADKVKSILASKVRLSNNTKRHYCNSLKSLFSFMGRWDLVKLLPKIKVEETEQVFWTEDEMFEIVAEIKSDTPARSEQYRQYFDLQRLVGSRAGESYEVRWKDLNEDNGCLTFSGQITKNRKTRVVPLPTRFWAELEVRRGEPDERIFNLVSSNPTRRYKVLQRALKKCGLKGSAHCFRRSRSEILYRKPGADLKAISELLGHSPSISLEFYKKARTVEELRKLVED